MQELLNFHINTLGIIQALRNAVFVEHLTLPLPL